MCILYSKSINSLVNNAFNFLKAKVSYFELLNRKQKLQEKQQNSNGADADASNDLNFSRDEFFFYNLNLTSNSVTEFDNEIINNRLYLEQDDNLLIEHNLGLTALKRLDYDLDKASYMHTNNLGYNLIKYEESQFDKINEESVFFRLCEKLFEKCKASVDACEQEEEAKGILLSKNPRQGQKLLYYFTRQFSSTLPLWTKLMLPLENQEFHLPISLQLHEERFAKLLSQLSINDISERESLDSLIKRIHAENQSLIQENVKIFGLNESEFTFNIWSKPSDSELAKLKKTFQYSGRMDEIDEITQLKLAKSLKQNGLKPSRNKSVKRNKNELLKLKAIMDRKNEMMDIINNNDKPVSDENVFSLICLSESDLNEPFIQVDNNEDAQKMIVIEKPVVIMAGREKATEDNDNEKEVVIERQHQILANKFGFELIKEDLETLEIPNSLNSNVKQLFRF
jgi:hypothetical protein